MSTWRKNFKRRTASFLVLFMCISFVQGPAYALDDGLDGVYEGVDSAQMVDLDSSQISELETGSMEADSTEDIVVDDVTTTQPEDIVVEDDIDTENTDENTPKDEIENTDELQKDFNNVQDTEQPSLEEDAQLEETSEEENEPEEEAEEIAALEIDDYASLKAALAGEAQTLNLMLTGDITAENESIVIPAGKTVTIDLAGHTITGAYTGASESNVITVEGTLTIKGQTGTVTSSCSHPYNKNVRGIYVAAGGFFQLGAEGEPCGVQICGNILEQENWNQVVHSSGAGVHVSDGASFAMYGGEICDNQAEQAGGVYIGKGANFTMHGGTIRGNNNDGRASADPNIKGGGGVCVNQGSFVMYAGEISNNRSEYGAGVYIGGTTGSFTMHGGKIEKNYTHDGAGSNGGGVFVEQGGTFTMVNGEICKNYAHSSGSGVIVSDATFTMQDGTISENSSHYVYASGVAIWQGGMFEISGGTISNNLGKDDSGGYGVLLEAGKFEMKGGVITNHGERGVLIHDGQFQLQDGEICNNAGGVKLYLWDSDKGKIDFEMSGGKIINNESADCGGIEAWNNARRRQGIFVTLTGGEITGNKAKYGGGCDFTNCGVTAASKLDQVSVYNNTATIAGDDLYCSTGLGYDTWTKTEIANRGWKLEPCGHDIDGWYVDTKDARWNCLGENTKVENGRYATALKAAHSGRAAGSLIYDKALADSYDMQNTTERFEPDTLVQVNLDGGVYPEPPAGSGSDSFEEKIVKDGTVTLQNPVKAGYIFTGWLRGGNRENPVLTPRWIQEKTFTIKFDTQGGNKIEPISFTRPLKTTMLRDIEQYNKINRIVPVKEGYVFDSWSLEPNEDAYIGSFAISQDVPQEDSITLYARWNKDACATMHFETFGGAPAPQDVSATRSFFESEDETKMKEFYKSFTAFDAPPTLSGYKLNGWYLDLLECYRNSNNPEIREAANEFEKDLEEYRQDLEKKLGDKEITEEEYQQGLQEIEGTKFPRIASAEKCVEYLIAAIADLETERIIVYADWVKEDGTKPTAYRLHYDANGGENAPADILRFAGEEVVVAEQTPTREGYIFTGWNDRKDGQGGAYAKNAKLILMRDITLYAQWQRTITPIQPMVAMYQVEHYQEQLDGSYKRVDADTTRLFGNIGVTVTATTQSYAFYHVNEAVADAMLSGVVVQPTANADGTPQILTLKVYYDLDAHTVQYDLNGGKGVGALDYAEESVKHGVSVTVKAAPIRDGYTFTGWNVENTIYQQGDTFAVLHDVILVAQWKEETSKPSKPSTPSGGNSGGSSGNDVGSEDNPKNTVDDTKNVEEILDIPGVQIPLTDKVENSREEQLTIDDETIPLGEAVVAGTQTPTNGVVQTGDNAPIVAYMLLVVAAIGGIFVARRKSN